LYKKIKHKFSLEIKNFKIEWTRNKRFNLKTSSIIFFLKYCIVTFTRLISKQSFDHNLSFFKLLISIIISLPRSFIVRLIKILDLYFPPLFGAVQTEVERKINQSDISTNLKTSNSGIDIRMLIWKREALDILIDIIKKKKINHIKIMEIGAANGMVSLMLAKWAENQQISFEGTCIEPSFTNIDFLQQMTIKNKFNIRIIPCVVNEEDRWTSFEYTSTKGYVADAIENKNNIIYKYSLTMDEIMTSVFEPNLIYIDALKNETQIVDKLLNRDFHNTNILVEFDTGVSENIYSKCRELNLEIIKIDEVHYIICKKINN
jgi:hypothetical protein